MSGFCCNCNNKCACTSIIASIIIGIVAGILRITGVISVTPAFAWVTFGIAVGYLAILLITSRRRSTSEHCCNICTILSILLTGILGAILTSVILLAIEFVATSIIGAIITGALLFFFALIVTLTACLVRCFANCDD